jgi:hypothetical protein
MPAVTLLIPDAGPLISLAKGGALDLLLRLDLPIVIADQVVHEATRRHDLDDARVIRAFIENAGDRVTVFETQVGTMAEAKRAAGDTGSQRGLGEAAIAEMLNRLDEVTGDADAPVLLLFEDDDVRRSSFIVPENVHVVSTWALLKGMERRGLIRSADAVWNSIVSAGRRPGKADIDKPGTSSGGRTNW